MVAMTDEEQKTQVKSFMQSYGFPIIIGVALGAGGFLGWNWFQNKQFSGNAIATDVVYQAIAKAQTPDRSDAEVYKVAKANLEKIINAEPNSVQSVQALMALSLIAYDNKDFALAEKSLAQAHASSVKDEGLKSVAGIHLANLHIEQKQFDKALQLLDKITLPSFTPTVSEAKGDAFVGLKKPEEAKKAYQMAWDALIERKEYRELLQMKLANLGVFVETPNDILPVKQAEEVAKATTVTPTTTPTESTETASSASAAASSAN